MKQELINLMALYLIIIYFFIFLNKEMMQVLKLYFNFNAFLT